MLKEYARVFSKIMFFLDLVMVWAAFLLAHTLRYAMGGFIPLNGVIMYLPVLLLIWGALLHYFGMYLSFRTSKMRKIIIIIARATVYGFLVFNAITYLLHIPNISRLFTGFSFLFSAVLLVIEKFFVMKFLRYTRRKGYNYRNILIIGTGKRAQHLIEVIKAHVEWGLRIIGLIDEETSRVGDTVNGYRVIGTLEQLPDVLHANVIDEVVFVVPRSWLHKIEPAMMFCEKEGIKIHLAVDYFELSFSKAKQNELNGFPLLSFESTPDKIWHLLIKRVIDLMIAGMALAVTWPLFIAIAVSIKLTSKGPVFFKQIRCGLSGRKFVLYKFRTMVENAESIIQGLIGNNEMSGPVFKMKNDPRLTKPGRFLRKLSLDELPQLWNVIKGDMSIVGPRPPIPKEVNEYESWHRRRLSMRPGITCLWQVNGRNKITDFNQWIKLDLDYIDHWSLWLDCKIIMKTIPVVLTGEGAE